MSDTTWKILTGDVRETLRQIADGSVQACVTSPPYWGGVRDYGHDGQLGMERQPEAYVAAMVAVFAEVRRTLRPDASLWINVGDVYAASGKGGGGCADRSSWSTITSRPGFRQAPTGYKPKDLTLVAFQLADALRRDGWYLRQTVIWQKASAVEPMRLDRPALSHEYLFLLTRDRHAAIRNPGELWWGHSVWKINADNTATGHPATMPTEIARRAIVCSTSLGDLVLDPFAGSGTTGEVALRLGRSFVGCELNPAYVALAEKRIGNAAPLFSERSA